MEVFIKNLYIFESKNYIDPRREFGISLEKLMKQSSKPFRIFCIIINYLDNNALDIPNIFHDYGDNSLINIIKKKLDEGIIFLNIKIS